MPRGILGSLVVAIILFVAVALVLVGMFHYSQYANNAEPVGWALRQSGHGVVAAIVQGYFCYRYVYCIDWYDVGWITFTILIWTRWFIAILVAKLNHKHLPNRSFNYLDYHCSHYRFNVPIRILGTIDFSWITCCIYVCIYRNVSFT